MNIAIIGAGASGLMCACQLPKHHIITLIEKNATSGKKLLLTGKGRCNITNLCAPNSFLNSIPQNAEFLAHAINLFTPQSTVDFFNDLGLETITENNNRIFPKTGKAQAVRQILELAATANGARFLYNTQANSIQKSEKGFAVSTTNLATNQSEQLEFDTVIVATGGLSYSATGSTGDGYSFAFSLGHNIITPRPSLCGIQLIEPAGFMGTSVQVKAKILDPYGRSVLSIRNAVGEIMFTKLGISGPAIFRNIAHFKGQSLANYTLAIDFMPFSETEELVWLIEKAIIENADKSVFYVLRKFLPQNIANWLTDISNINKAKPVKTFKIKERAVILELLKDTQVAIKGFDPIDTATITRGGVDVSQIDPTSMQSKLVTNLYIIGEALDVDGLSGGYNLQIAFSTAAACAKSFA